MSRDGGDLGEAGPTVLYGFHPVREALRHEPHRFERILVAPGRAGKRLVQIEELAERHGVPIERAPESRLRELAAGPHNGFVAQLGPGVAAARRGDPDLVVLLEDVQDPRNLGALLRVCEGAGVGEVWIRDRGSAPLTGTVAKTSAGAMDWLAIRRITNPFQEMSRAKEQGYWIYGADGSGAPPWTVDLSGRVVLCLGGEHKGLRRKTREHCDAMVGLPMRGRVESLNVATAAAALLYEIVRQRTG